VIELSEAGRALLGSARVAHLATADQYARPHVVPIVFVWIEPSLFFPLDRKPKQSEDWHQLRRIRNLETNGRTSIVVDRWDEDWTKLAWVLLEGLATILEGGEDRDRAATWLAEKYAQYGTHGLDGCPIVRVAVEHAVEWHSAAAR